MIPIILIRKLSNMNAIKILRHKQVLHRKKMLRIKLIDKKK